MLISLLADDWSTEVAGMGGTLLRMLLTEESLIVEKFVEKKEQAVGVPCGMECHHLVVMHQLQREFFCEPVADVFGAS